MHATITKTSNKETTKTKHDENFNKNNRPITNQRSPSPSLSTFIVSTAKNVNSYNSPLNKTISENFKSAAPTFIPPKIDQNLPAGYKLSNSTRPKFENKRSILPKISSDSLVYVDGKLKKVSDMPADLYNTNIQNQNFHDRSRVRQPNHFNYNRNSSRQALINPQNYLNLRSQNHKKIYNFVPKEEEQNEDIRAYQERLTEIFDYYRRPTRKWKLIFFILTMIFTISIINYFSNLYKILTNSILTNNYPIDKSDPNQGEVSNDNQRESAETFQPFSLLLPFKILINHKVLLISGTILAVLILLQQHKKIISPDILEERLNDVLKHFSMSVDNKGTLKSHVKSS